MVRVRSFFYSIVLVAVTFAIAYVINMALIFGGTPQPWGQYTGLLVTFVAFVVACLFLFMAKKGGDKK